MRKATGSYRTYSSLVKLQLRFLSLQWKTCIWAELQAWCLSLQWRTCPWAEHWLWWWKEMMSTAVAQHARLSHSGSGFNPGLRQVSRVRFLRGFSSPVSLRQMSGSFEHTLFPDYHLAIIIILVIFALLEWVSEWMVCILFNKCLCCLGGGTGIEMIPHPGRPSISLCGQKVWRDPKLIPSPDRSWLCDVKTPIREKLKYGNERMNEWIERDRIWQKLSMNRSM